ncbi:hypothetical protein BDV95DRAFT_569037 [Massariosphaeria phaeospora]|uniref:Uncharacterized protein n=1 Tax=Massariosphaeria phaeospora TaxID=100035 RepID=A0A7C8M9Z0_9PLEO|nr:hypothetical protein BDV95DRAFT_569037 [Massariosphaeria phaeospora]
MPPPPQKRSRSIRDFFTVSTPSGHGSTPSATNTNTAPRPPAWNVPETPQSDSSAQKPAKSPTPPTLIGKSFTTGVSSTPQPADRDTRPPPASQSSANSAGSKKRTVSNGEQVVLNSDSETDSLPELDWGEPPQGLKETRVPMPATTRSKSARHGEDELRRPGPAQKRSEKASFSRLVQAAQKIAELEQKIADGKADLDKPLDDTPPPEFIVSEEAMAQVMNNDEDPEKAKRLYLAMQRTNALHSECVFHFFQEDVFSCSPAESEFPIGSLPDHQWVENLQDQTARDQAFLTGFVQLVFKYQQLPEELASWMIEQVCIGRSPSLNARYLQLLESDHLRKLLDNARLDVVFKSIGTDMHSLNPLQQVVPSHEPHPASKRPLPPSLNSVVALLLKAAPYLQLEARSHALCILLHLCLDHSVMSDASSLHLVQDAIEAVMCNITDNANLTKVLDDIIFQLLRRISHPVLQHNLVRSLPAKSPLTAEFQRLLALSFLVYPTEVNCSTANPEAPSLILAHLRESPNFNMVRGTDYTSLAARLSLLDIGIGPGPGNVPFKHLQEDSSGKPVPCPFSPDDRAFNQKVDELAKQIKMVGNSIVESGALTDLTRLEAKDCCERLYHRLEYVVRIGGKQKADPIVSAVDSEYHQVIPKITNFYKPKDKSVNNTAGLTSIGGAVNGVANGGDTIHRDGHEDDMET